MIRLNVQLTREEVEILLDALGAEEIGETEERKHLKRKLEEVLQYRKENDLDNNLA